MTEGEKKSVVYEVADWLWGTVKGGFNEQASISQIIVDAVIGMIPVVGDVTAVRDLIAVILRLAREPKKRHEVLEWVTLVLLLFALIPVVGGLIKGVGKLLVKASAGVGKHAELLRDMIQLLNRLGSGNAVKFLKELSFEKYAPELLGKWRELTQRLDVVIEATLRRMHALLPEEMVAHLKKLQAQLKELAGDGERMIPEAVKELHKRLKAIQRHLYDGEWHEIAAAATSKTYKSVTREAEARLVMVADKDGRLVPRWEGKDLHYPPNPKEAFEPVNGWPNLSTGAFVAKGEAWAVAAFSGPIRPVKLQPGTKIYRVVTAGGKADGLWWAYKLPKDGKAWREELAVLESWSGNGYFVEFVVREPGLVAWEGKVAGQIENTSVATNGQYLKGGATQLLIDFAYGANKYAAGSVAATKRQATHWTAAQLTNLNVPAKGETVQKLGIHEIEPKLTETTARIAGVGQRPTRAAEAEQEDRVAIEN